MITRDDIRLFQAQVNNDEENGGGSMSGNEVVDGEINNLFPDVSRIDVTNGDVAMRKVFPAVISQNTDVYYGMHSIIRKNPDDERVSVTMVNTKDPHDQRTEAQTKVESALTFSYEAQFYLYGNHIEGMRALTFMGRLATEPPPIGEAFYLYDELNDQGQYVRITGVETIKQILSFANGNTYTDYERLLFICEITAGLEHAFSGSEFNPAGNQSNVKTFHTTQANAVTYHGTKTLASDLDDQTAVMQLDSIFNQLVPASINQEAMVNQQGPRDIDFLITGIPDDYDGNFSTLNRDGLLRGSWPITLSASNNYTATIDFGFPVEPGSVNYASNRDQNGVLVAGSVTIAIDYVNGIGVATTDGVYYNNSLSILFDRASKVTIPARFTVAKDVTSANNSLVFVQNIHPIPSPGSLRVEYRSGGKWYEIYMTSPTTLGANASIGAGSVNYNGDGSATVSVTLGSEPDIGSKILYTWGQASGIGTEDYIPEHQYRIDVPLAAGEKLLRVSLEFLGSYYGGVTYEWDGAGFVKIGSLQGAMTGRVDADRGIIYIDSLTSSSGTRVPNDVIVSYDTVASDVQTEITAPNGSGIVSVDVGAALAAGDFYIQYPLTIQLNTSPSVTVEETLTVSVDQTGTVVRAHSGRTSTPSSLFNSAQLSNFNVDPSGIVTFHPTAGLSAKTKNYEATTDSTTTVKKSYSSASIQWQFGG